ncbi:Mobile element protein [Candidatus Enterovibrio escicola]|uniref:Mobile element protein n=1 Tax=Candidatus Enterovibrio escicola TaxID=1927127 RepID=A0A2A5T5N8_9GAMM|nr:Mobile element protein [Candidatus Enterovibrio escacola]
MIRPSYKICYNFRILRHQVFKGTSKRGKGRMAWFLGIYTEIKVISMIHYSGNLQTSE